MKFFASKKVHFTRASSNDGERLADSPVARVGNRPQSCLYEITPKGRKRLDEEEKRWRSVTAAVVKVLGRV